MYKLCLVEHWREGEVGDPNQFARCPTATRMINSPQAASIRHTPAHLPSVEREMQDANPFELLKCLGYARSLVATASAADPRDYRYFINSFTN